MARLGVSPVIKLYDTDGTVLASGTVETYITGTSTAKNSYSSAAGAGTATSFTLDANGEAVRYFDTDVAYKLIIKDSLGTTVRTIDPYLPISDFSSLSADLDMAGFSIVSSSGGDINLTPDTTGSVILDGLSWPQADGTVNQVLQTDGAGTLSFVTKNSDVVNDATPQLGGDLDTNSYNIQFDDAKGILDDAGNEQLIFNKTASAVNYIEITNGESGTQPLIAASGSDSNVDLQLSGQGTGSVIISGLTYPSVDGVANQVLVTDGAGTLSFGSYITEATQAQQEAGTTSAAQVTPAVQHHHMSAAKGWVSFSTAGVIDDSYNVSSITDNGTGDFTVNWDTDFSSTGYVSVVSLHGTANAIPVVYALAAGTDQVVSRTSGGTATETNITSYMMVAFGDQ